MVTTTAFIADQTPSPENAFWTTFLNRDTPVFRALKKLPKNGPSYCLHNNKAARGYYNILAEVLSEDSKNTAEGQISELHTTRLEKDIREQPEIWLWTHRRWKHKRPAEVN